MKRSCFLTKILLIMMLFTCMASSLLPICQVYAQSCPETAAGIQGTADCEFCNTDINRDGKTSIADASGLRMCLAMRCARAEFDVNSDGSVDQNDFQILMSCMKNKCAK
jgi:hypothetical protein